MPTEGVPEPKILTEPLKDRSEEIVYGYHRPWPKPLPEPEVIFRPTSVPGDGGPVLHDFPGPPDFPFPELPVLEPIDPVEFDLVSLESRESVLASVTAILRKEIDSEKLLPTDLDSFPGIELELVETRAFSGFEKRTFQQTLGGLPVLDSGVAVVTHGQNAIQGIDFGQLVSFQSSFDPELSAELLDLSTPLSEIGIDEEKVLEHLVEHNFPFTVTKNDIRYVDQRPGVRRLPYWQGDLLGPEASPRFSESHRERRALLRAYRDATMDESREAQVVVRVRVAVGSDCVEVELNPQTGEPVVVREVSRYQPPGTFIGKGRVFIPNPFFAAAVGLAGTHQGEALFEQVELLRKSLAQASGDDHSWLDRLERHLAEQDLPGLRVADGAREVALTGTHCRIQHWNQSPGTRRESPSSDGGDFRSTVRVDELSAVAAYFWIDRFRTYLRETLDVDERTLPDYAVPVDPFASEGSRFRPDCDPTVNTGVIALSASGYPDATDAAVVLHEYAHAVHQAQGFPGPLDLEEGWADVVALLYLDRFVPEGVPRGSVFPWDELDADAQNLTTVELESLRFVSAARSYSSVLLGSAAFQAFWRGDKYYEKGLFWASLVWQIFLALGGESDFPEEREEAADLLLKLHLEANALYARSGTPQSGPGTLPAHRGMARCLIDASQRFGLPGRPPGLCRKLLEWHCDLDRLLPFAPTRVDLFIDDGRKGGYGFQETEKSLRAPGVVVRRSDAFDELSEEPLAGETCFVWIHVELATERGSEDITLELLQHPGEESPWVSLEPIAEVHLAWARESAEPELLDAPGGIRAILESGRARVGPFPFRPASQDPVSLVVRVSSPDDPALAPLDPAGVSSRWMQRLDNNTARRLLVPV